MKVLDYDRFSRDDPIGEVCVPLCDVDLANGETLCRVLQTCKGHAVSSLCHYTGSLYLSVTPKFYTKVLHQTLNPTAELWCKTFSRIKVDLELHRT